MSPTTAKDKKDAIRIAAENDLETFIRLVHPNSLLGSIHQEVCYWINREGGKTHQGVLLPRDHRKSYIAGMWAAQQITKNPAIRILYISSTSTLAVKQLKLIKDVLTSPIYRRYWPEMVMQEEAKREKWTETEISVDHPLRKEENIRDATVFTAGLTTNVVGLHADIIILDDVVVNDTAYTEEGRKRLETQYSLLASVEGAEGRQLFVGTRYHPKDLYSVLLSMEMELFNDDGDIVGKKAIFELFGDGDLKKQQVEDRGDGTGEFLWPRQQRIDGKWFGFDRSILARKKGQYIDQTQFRAQYYNDPNDTASAGIKNEYFQYYDRVHLKREGGSWFVQGNRLNLFAAVDFAFSLSKSADYTAIVVVGVDHNQNYYVLDIDRLRTDSIKEYFARILRLHQKWGFHRLRAEVTAAQEAIVRSIKNDYVVKHGLALSIEEYRPQRSEGSKRERIKAVLQPRYENHQIWHYQGGNCQILEEELVLENPPHDDVKDCLASVVDSCIAPSYRRVLTPINTHKLQINNRFGGVA